MYIRERDMDGFSGSTHHDSSDGSFNRSQGHNNKGFDIERQNSNLSSHRSNASGSGSGSYIGANPQAPEAHKFKRQAPIPENPTQQAQNGPQTGVVYQPDGSYITAHSEDAPSTTGFDSNQIQTGSGGSKGSNQSLGYLRSVQNTVDF